MAVTSAGFSKKPNQKNPEYVAAPELPTLCKNDQKTATNRKQLLTETGNNAGSQHKQLTTD